jgi:urease accessory protein
LVSGDAIALEVDAGPGTRCLLSTQASTKVYRSAGPACGQQLNVSAAADAVVVSAPDPVVCFADAAFDQRQRFELAADAGLILVDWLTSGRKARGERWAFQRYSSDTEVSVEHRCVFRDTVLLDRVDGPIAAEMRMGRVDCFATVVVVGPPGAGGADRLLRHVAALPARGEPVCSASPIAGGAVARVAGRDVEAVGNWIRDRLAGLASLLGQDLWRRKW